MKQSEWFSCYANGWAKNDIVPEAFSHPAKFSKQLIARIYEHLLGQGYIVAGEKIADPFGGVALGALHAMRNGLHWHGCELEPRFVALGEQNIALWNNRYSAHFPNWGTARIVRGDSRELARVLGEAGCVVSSPPFSPNGNQPSAGRQFVRKDYSRSKWADSPESDYGGSPGQLGSMPEGNISAVISSPPYADAISNETSGIDWAKSGRPDRTKPSPNRRNTMTDGVTKYGDSAGNLGNLGVGAVVSSPPFENKLSAEDIDFYQKKCVQTGRNPNSAHATGINTYGQASGNIGNDTGDNFWTAAQNIVSQCYQILKPGGVAAFVTGDFVRSGDRVRFGEQWLALCESVGFQPLEWIVAWKREPGPIQAGIFGNDKDLTKDRVSFFRRLSNQKNPNNEIVNEDVIIVQRPF